MRASNLDESEGNSLTLGSSKWELRLDIGLDVERILLLLFKKGERGAIASSSSSSQISSRSVTVLRLSLELLRERLLLGVCIWALSLGKIDSLLRRAVSSSVIGVDAMVSSAELWPSMKPIPGVKGFGATDGRLMVSS